MTQFFVFGSLNIINDWVTLWYSNGLRVLKPNLGFRLLYFMDNYNNLYMDGSTQSSLILIMRINVDHNNFQPTLNWSRKLVWATLIVLFGT